MLKTKQINVRGDILKFDPLAHRDGTRERFEKVHFCQSGNLRAEYVGYENIFSFSLGLTTLSVMGRKG